MSHALAARGRGAALAAACALAVAATLALAVAVRAQTPGTGPLLPGTHVRENDLPLIFAAPQNAPAESFQQRFVPLDPGHEWRLRRAIDLRLGGRVRDARDTLLALDRQLPHRPQIALELARTDIALADFAGAAARLRAERAALHDSLLGAPELMQACERLGRPHDALAVVLEALIAAPVATRWGQQQLLRLAPADPKGALEPLRAAVAKRPERADLARVLAFLLARSGRPDEAARALAAGDRPGEPLSRRRTFADEALLTGVPADTLAALAALVDLAADSTFRAPDRTAAARRAEGAAPFERRGEVAEQVARALGRVPLAQWGPDLVLDTARALRESGRAGDASALLARGGALGMRSPEIELERAFALLREGPPAHGLPALDSLAHRWQDARFPLAEAQFWAGELDSALANYQRVADRPEGPDALAALERAYLLEAEPQAPELRTLGTLAYLRWRGDGVRARALADSLWRALPGASAYRASAALQSAELAAEAGAWREALAPLALVADSLAGDRLAPLARQRAGEALLQLGDERGALAQFEECLARYPKAWNSAEVRRQVERLRKERRL